jgi:hypothetical protein
VEAKREYFNKLDVVNCGIGMSSINIKRDVTKQEVRDLVHGDSGSPYQDFKAYIRMMDNPLVKLDKIRIFLKNIGWDLKGEKVFVARRRKENGQHESIEEERERTLQYFYDQAARLEKSRSQQAMTVREVEFEHTLKRKHLQDKIDELDQEKAKQISCKLDF